MKWIAFLLEYNELIFLKNFIFYENNSIFNILSQNTGYFKFSLAWIKNLKKEKESWLMKLMIN